MAVSLRLELPRHEFQPGDEIEGVASWSADAAIDALTLRLGWHTEGRGDREAAVAEQSKIEDPPREGRQAFSFSAPESPYSFSGKLVSLVWEVSLQAYPGKEVVAEVVTISPTGREIALHEPPATGDAP